MHYIIPMVHYRNIVSKRRAWPACVCPRSEHVARLKFLPEGSRLNLISGGSSAVAINLIALRDDNNEVLMRRVSLREDEGSERRWNQVAFVCISQGPAIPAAIGTPVLTAMPIRLASGARAKP